MCQKCKVSGLTQTTGSETLGWGRAIYFNKPSMWFWCMLMSKNHWGTQNRSALNIVTVQFLTVLVYQAAVTDYHRLGSLETTKELRSLAATELPLHLGWKSTDYGCVRFCFVFFFLDYFVPLIYLCLLWSTWHFPGYRSFIVNLELRKPPAVLWSWRRGGWEGLWVPSQSGEMS